MSNSANNKLETSEQAKKSENQLDEATLDTVHGGVYEDHSAPKADIEAQPQQKTPTIPNRYGNTFGRTL